MTPDEILNAERDGEVAIAPPLCEGCKALIVEQLDLGPDGPWQVVVLGATSAVTFAAMASPVVLKRVGAATPTDISIVLNELGCLGCWQPEALGAGLSVIVEAGGLPRFFEVLRGQRKSRFWPARWCFGPGTKENEDG